MFIREGIRLILLYLYERKQPSKAAGIAFYLGWGGTAKQTQGTL